MKTTKHIIVSQSRTSALVHLFSYAIYLGQISMGHPKWERQIDTSYFQENYAVSIQATTAVAGVVHVTVDVIVKRFDGDCQVVECTV